VVTREASSTTSWRNSSSAFAGLSLVRFYREGAQRRTDDNGCCLRNFANLFILLHDFLNTRLQKEKRKEKGIGKDALDMTDGQHEEAHHREFRRLVSIFHDGCLGVEDLAVGTDAAGRVRRGNVRVKGTSGTSLLGPTWNLFYVWG
jgi:hypothetical protein